MPPAALPSLSSPGIAVIGGSGLYSLFDEGAESHEVATPYGPVTVDVGVLAGRTIVFLPRHGAGHSVPPHRLNARATAWALASGGVTALISTAAVGSITADLPVGAIAVADQLVDRTHGRDDTFFDGDLVRHLPFADPFCPRLRETALTENPDLVDGATVGVIQGPRFSTRAESRIHASDGIHLLNMTLCPEIALAAEVGIGAIALCAVTDTDTGSAPEEAVTADVVFARLDEIRPRLVGAIRRTVASIPDDYVPRELMDAESVAAVLARPVA